MLEPSTSRHASPASIAVRLLHNTINHLRRTNRGSVRCGAGSSLDPAHFQMNCLLAATQEPRIRVKVSGQEGCSPLSSARGALFPNATKNDKQIRIVLFDLGGVLLRYRDEWFAKELSQRWGLPRSLVVELVLRFRPAFQSGDITMKGFAGRVADGCGPRPP
jgi:hypothetical protein